MSAQAQPRALRARALMRPYALAYFYRRRLRVHGAQELFAGAGVAIAVALMFAVMVANGSIAGSAGEVTHAVIGPASLQLRARGADGVGEGLLGRVRGLAGVVRAAPLLEQTATIVEPGGRSATVDLAGTTLSLAVLDGLARKLPIAALAPGGIGISSATAVQLGLTSARTRAAGGRTVSLLVRGYEHPVAISAVLGPESFGALARAQVAVMPLARLQALAGLPGRVTRILVQTRPGRQAAVRGELAGLAGGGVAVASADEDVALLHQALGPSNQASAMFAVISVLLGFLFAFNAMLLTVPERRQVIADLHVAGTRRAAIVQMVVFQALCLGLVASLVGLAGGYGLSVSVFHQSPGYLARAFALGTSTVVGPAPVALALAGGVLATGLASMVPLLDLRGSRALDAVYFEDGVPGNALGTLTRWRLFVAAVSLVVLASVLFLLVPAGAIVACVALAVATVLAVPLALSGVLAAGEWVAGRFRGLTILPVALFSLKATALRSLALAATGALALFGSIALGGARDDLLRGIDDYTSHYVGAADIWVVNPGDNQAIDDFAATGQARRIARVPGVSGVSAFQGGFVDLGGRRVWTIAWPASVAPTLLQGQVVAGTSPSRTSMRLREGGWIAVSRQIAAEHHVGVGGTLALPTPSGTRTFKIAATTTNFGWTPGAILMSTRDFGRAWGTGLATALGVHLTANADPLRVRAAIQAALGPRSGLEVSTARARAARIDASASEGLSQLSEISTLLVVAAILAMAAALGSSIWQRRVSLAGLRLAGVSAGRLRRILLLEATLMLSAGCLAGALAGVYGQIAIDDYLRNVTGFPVTGLAASGRPLEIFALVIAAVLAIVSVPGWLASRVSPALALDA
ncbi:MAG TPA: ABC transporter permease [Solirubrobacteraceae bacterium]|nr:ABC transporter permease [Solirubrobacteraceae bacterium]